MEDKVLEVLKNVDEEIVTYEGENLFDAGILDSVQAVSLVAELEEALGIEIDAAYVVEENFKTKDAIIEMVRKIIEEK